VYAVALVMFNLLVDLLYHWVDPRIDIERSGAQGS
jgi:ABC-type dipeptide/oligopeptide/nickel transport system permease component